MSPAGMGAAAGAVFGLVNYAALRGVAAHIEQKPGDKSKRASTARIIHGVAVADLVLFPVAGYFIGPLVLI